jgi:hypothetical protein
MTTTCPFMVIHSCILFYLELQFILPWQDHSNMLHIHNPINATQSHHFKAMIIQRYCWTTHLPPDHTIHLNPCSWHLACAMGIAASMPAIYHHNHQCLFTPIPIPTHSTLTSHITTLLGLLDWTLETLQSFHTLATLYPATQSIPEETNHQEMVWYKWSHKVSSFRA